MQAAVFPYAQEEKSEFEVQSATDYHVIARSAATWQSPPKEE